MNVNTTRCWLLAGFQFPIDQSFFHFPVGINGGNQSAY